MTAISREAVVAEALSWEGVPYRHCGRSKEFGVDCIGLGIVTYSPWVDMDRPDYRRYPRMPQSPAGFLPYLAVHGWRCLLERREWLQGDLGVYWINPRTRWVQHAGIFTPEGIIHAYAKRGRVNHERHGDYWNKRHIATYRHELLDN